MKRSKLTWYGKGKRWFKSYQRKQHAVSCRQLWEQYPHLMVADTKEGSQKAAEAWWEHKYATLAAHPQAADYRLAIETRQLMAEWCRRENKDRVQILEEIDRFKKAEKQGVMLTTKRMGELRGWQMLLSATLWLGDLPVDPSNKPVDGETWGARVEQIKKVLSYETTKQTTSLRDLAQKFCEHKSVDVSPFRVETINRQLMDFCDFVGKDNVHAIEFEPVLADYRVWLVKQSGFASPTQDQRLKIAKAFATWLWDTARVIDECPRNLKKLTIKVETHEPESWTDEEVRELLERTSGQQKLYYLLMLNCGMYQGDIGQLKKTQVNFQDGTITRARSKTEGNGGRVVTYPLWQETLELLRQCWSDDEELALTTLTGAPLYYQRLKENGKVARKDMINTTHHQWQKRNGLRFPALKNLRKTGRNKLDEHDSHARCAIYYLAHSAQTIDDRYYHRTPEPARFAAAIRWLGEQWGIR